MCGTHENIIIYGLGLDLAWTWLLSMPGRILTYVNSSHSDDIPLATFVTFFSRNCRTAL